MTVFQGILPKSVTYHPGLFVTYLPGSNLVLRPRSDGDAPEIGAKVATAFRAGGERMQQRSLEPRSFSFESSLVFSVTVENLITVHD